MGVYKAHCGVFSRANSKIFINYQYIKLAHDMSFMPFLDSFI